MYRDDVCATCGESLPPDHVYCREHAAEVDARLHVLGEALPPLLEGLAAASRTLGELAPETFDYVAEQEDDDPSWPPIPRIDLRADPEEVTVDVDSEPGYVRVRLEVPLTALLRAVAEGLSASDLLRFAQGCARTEGANATH